VALLVSLEQAIANALARWLRTSLGPDVVVDSRWPEANTKLPPRAVTVLLAGPPEEEPLDPVLAGREDTSPTTSRFKWRMRAMRQPLQIDAWACYDVERDDLRQRLRSALNAGMRRTLGLANAMPVDHGVVVPLEDGWQGGIADCFFDKPQSFDTPDAVQRSEYRLTYRGWAEAVLTETAESPRIVAVRLRQRIRAARTTTITAASVTNTED
jgi:hypothetical protein